MSAVYTDTHVYMSAVYTDTQKIWILTQNLDHWLYSEVL